jgi:hypothetical protein
MRPKLPGPLEDELPDYVLGIIYSYVPHTKRPKKEHSPSLQRELERIQKIELKGKSANYMKGFSNFCLD